AGGVETDDEVARAVALDDAFEALAEQGVAGGRFREGQLVGGGLEVVAQEGGVVAVAGGVDADATAARRLRSGSRVWYHGTLGRKKWRQQGAVAARVLRRPSDREEACDKRSAPQDVTSSWARRGGVNLQQEVAPQQTERPP